METPTVMTIAWRRGFPPYPPNCDWLKLCQYTMGGLDI